MRPTDGRTPTPREWVGLAAFLVLPFAATLVGRRTRGDDAEEYYRSLPLPDWAADAALFGPVWLVLSLLLGVSAWLVWRRWGWSGSGGALNLWLLQLGLHAAWTPVFFGLRDPLSALIVMVLLLLAVIATITAFWRRSRLAAWLLVPYALWVAYATALNGTLWWHSP